MKEHRRGLYSNYFSEFANHIIETDHSFHSYNLKLLHPITSKGKIMNNLENLEIQKNLNSEKTIINNIIFQNTSPLLSMFPLKQSRLPSS